MDGLKCFHTHVSNFSIKLLKAVVNDKLCVLSLHILTNPLQEYNSVIFRIYINILIIYLYF